MSPNKQIDWLRGAAQHWGWASSFSNPGLFATTYTFDALQLSAGTPQACVLCCVSIRSSRGTISPIKPSPSGCTALNPSLGQSKVSSTRRCLSTRPESTRCSAPTGRHTSPSSRWVRTFVAFLASWEKTRSGSNQWPLSFPVRDAAARLPNGEGTRAEICELLKDSQFLAPDVTSAQVGHIWLWFCSATPSEWLFFFFFLMQIWHNLMSDRGLILLSLCCCNHLVIVCRIKVLLSHVGQHSC